MLTSISTSKSGVVKVTTQSENLTTPVVNYLNRNGIHYVEQVIQAPGKAKQSVRKINL